MACYQHRCAAHKAKVSSSKKGGRGGSKRFDDVVDKQTDSMNTDGRAL